jgi:hypothetical protein
MRTRNQDSSEQGDRTEMCESNDVSPTETGPSRRDVLAGAAGALGALALASLTKAAPAHAADGDPLTLGTSNSESTATLLTQSTTTQDGLEVVGGDNSFVGISGASPSGAGVGGFTFQGDGVLGQANLHGNGVHGTTPDVQGYGVFGENSAGGYGVFGQTNSTGRAGVWGDNQGSGPGVYGSSNGIGVEGVVSSSGGLGVRGVTNGDGIGVSALAATPTGVALSVLGTAQFSLSGITAIAAGAKSVTVRNVSLRSASLVFATVQNIAGVSVAYAVPNASSSTIVINLNKAVPTRKTANVAWFVVN